MRRLLITGGSGYLGAELVRQASKQGDWDIYATTFSQHLSDSGVRYLPLDITKHDDVERVLGEIAPAVVIHTAYRQYEPNLYKTTAAGSGSIAQATHSVGARLIHLSSDVIFDGERVGSYTEQDKPTPITPYGVAKADAEQLVARFYPDALIVRTSLIYGGKELSKHEQLVLDVADGHTDLAFFVDEIRCPIQVGDLAQALLELAVMEVTGPLNVAGADLVSRYEFSCLVAAAHGRLPEKLRSASSAASGLRRPRNCSLDSSVAQHLIGTRLRGVREVLGRLSD